MDSCDGWKHIYSIRPRNEKSSQTKHFQDGFGKSKSELLQTYSIHILNTYIYRRKSSLENHLNFTVSLSSAGMSSGQASCSSLAPVITGQLLLCAATTTDGQLEQPASGQRDGQRAASAAAVALVLSDKPLLVLRPHYGDKVNRRFMGSFLDDYQHV